MQNSILVLVVLLCIVIVSDIQLPPTLVNSLGSSPAALILLLLVYYLYTVHPLLGLVSIVAAYTLLQRSGYLNSNKDRIPTLLELQNDLPNTVINGVTYSSTNQFPTTLEESVINNLVPLR